MVRVIRFLLLCRFYPESHDFSFPTTKKTDNLRKRAWPKLVGLHEFYVELLTPDRGNVPPRPPGPISRPPIHPRSKASAQSAFLDDDSSICSTLSHDTIEGYVRDFYAP